MQGPSVESRLSMLCCAPHKTITLREHLEAGGAGRITEAEQQKLDVIKAQCHQIAQDEGHIVCSSEDREQQVTRFRSSTRLASPSSA